jgi:hypothetical protein
MGVILTLPRSISLPPSAARHLSNDCNYYITRTRKCLWARSADALVPALNKVPRGVPARITIERLGSGKAS